MSWRGFYAEWLNNGGIEGAGGTKGGQKNDGHFQSITVHDSFE